MIHLSLATVWAIVMVFLIAADWRQRANLIRRIKARGHWIVRFPSGEQEWHGPEAQQDGRCRLCKPPKGEAA